MRMKWRRRKIEGKNNKLKKAYNLNNGLEIYDFIVLKYCALKIYKIKVKTKKWLLNVRNTVHWIGKSI